MTSFKQNPFGVIYVSTEIKQCIKTEQDMWIKKDNFLKLIVIYLYTDHSKFSFKYTYVNVHARAHAHTQTYTFTFTENILNIFYAPGPGFGIEKTMIIKSKHDLRSSQACSAGGQENFNEIIPQQNANSTLRPAMEIYVVCLQHIVEDCSFVGRAGRTCFI